MPKVTQEENLKAWRATDLGNMYCAWGRDTGIAGVHTIAALVPTAPMPLGVVHFRFCARKDEIETIDSYVKAPLQRRGVRTFINKELFRWWPDVTRIVTQQGTEDGWAWMMARGYKDKGTHLSVTRRQFERSLKK
jgi:hypothetical protein